LYQVLKDLQLFKDIKINKILWHNILKDKKSLIEVIKNLENLKYKELELMLIMNLINYKRKNKNKKKNKDKYKNKYLKRLTEENKVKV